MKKVLKGIITSDKMSKTVVVAVNTYKQFPIYKKFYKSRKKYKAHVESGEYRVGETVLIEQCRPISKDKKWKVIKKI